MAAVNPKPSVEPWVAACWELLPESIRPLGTGLINRSFLAVGRDGEKRVLQQVNPIFPPEVNEDIEAVTRHLEARGVGTPRLLRDRDGRLCVPDPRGAWRVLSYVEGRVLDAIARPEQAREAGRLLGDFHRALDDLEHEFRHIRPPVHEPARHLAALAEAVDAHRGHPLQADAAALAETLSEAAQALPPLPATPQRVVHGDPKISNLVYASDRELALCMLDLDTLGHMALPFELGDAFRSWCNLATEDDPRSRFSADYFAAAAAGYGQATAGWLRPDEAATVVTATATIQVELAARFCADALNESYFGWNPGLFPSRGEHNLARARGQLAVHRSLLEQRGRLEELAGRALDPGNWL